VEEARQPAASPVARLILVSGLVQGVGFRWHTREQARSLGVVGWVRNLPDGRVEVHAEGSQENVQRLLDWLAKGPRHARVERVDVQPAALERPRDFEQRYT
jgi:acylphosphatase